MSMLSKIIKSNIKGAVRAVGGAVGTIIGGPALGAAAYGAIKGAQTKSVALQGPVVHGPTVQTPGGWKGTLGSISLPSLPGLGPLSMPQGGRGRVAMVNGQCPKGYHPDKATRTFCARNRRTNFANGQAARRAGKRLRGTVKMLRKSFSLVEAKAPRGKFIPKRK